MFVHPPVPTHMHQMLELIVLIILCQALRFVNVVPKMKVQSAINVFNDSIKIFGLKRGAK